MMSPRLRVWALGSITAVVGLSVGVSKLFEKDPAGQTTCHDPVRHDHSVPFVSPRQDIALAITEDEWPELGKVLRRFSDDHDWSFHDDSRNVPGRLVSIQVDLCAENPLRILVSKNHWLNTSAFQTDLAHVPVTLYGDVPDNVWQPVGRELYFVLEARWPGKVGFYRGADVTMARPEYINRQ